MSEFISKYGAKWRPDSDEAQIEIGCIKKGGQWKTSTGKLCGNGLFYHYKELQKLFWPKDDHHRWSDLALQTMIDSEVSVFMGSGDSNKTYSMSRFVLCDWWAFPNETLWLVSSTEYRGAELRIWGKIKELFNRAKERYDYLCGTVLESMHAITTEEISDDQKKARSLQRGLILVPCKKGGTFVGLSAFVGVKAPRLRHAGDEVQHMETGFLDAYNNWYGKADFKGVMSGNPLDPTDPLCTAGEPLEGWDSWVDTGKTQTWKSKFFNASVIAFDGRDSPNFDFPLVEGKPKFPYLISNKKIDAVRITNGEDSWQYWNQCVGKPSKGMVLWRVITSQLCRQHRAHDQAEWEGTARTWVYAVDPAYGGGDRCVGMPLEFGMGLEEKQVMRIHLPEIIPIRVQLDVSPEDQIAQYVKVRLAALGIPTKNAFYDSFGRGTLGYSFARVFAADPPIPVDSGAQPTGRPVRFDLFVQDNPRDPNSEKRLKRCDEHYSKFISEMWFSVREVIEGDQMRELSRPVMDEGCLRMYSIVKGNRIEVESKDDMKERVKKSPDLFDALAIGVEGARRLGFKITRLGVDTEDIKQDDWMVEDAKEQESILQKRLLQHS